MSISLRRGPDREPGGGLFHRGLRETGRGGFWKRSVCLYEALRGEPKGVFLFWEP
jgi:hypothetical protein